MTLSCRLPFDWHTPFGYFVAAFIQIIAAICTNVFLIGVACPFLGACWLIISFSKDITNDLAHLKVRKLSNEKHREKLKQDFCRVFKLHSDAMQLSVSQLLSIVISRTHYFTVVI